MARIKIGNVFPSIEWLLERCAPAGFGYGGAMQQIDGSESNLEVKFSEILAAMENKSTKQICFTCSDGTLYGKGRFTATICKYDSQYAHLYATTYKNYAVMKSFYNGEWAPFEWVNPTLEAGVEFRTTERWMGKAVYVKLCDCGDLPNNSTKEFTLDIEKQTLVDLNAVAIGAGSTYKLPALHETDAGNKIAFWNTGVLIGVKTFASGWDGFKLYVTAKYTKD